MALSLKKASPPADQQVLEGRRCGPEMPCSTRVGTLPRRRPAGAGQPLKRALAALDDLYERLGFEESARIVEMALDA